MTERKLEFTSAVARHLHRDLVAEPDGGFSKHLVTGATPTAGWMVSEQPGAKPVVTSDVSRKHIQDFVAANADRLQAPAAHLGGWTNREETPPRSYVDVSIRHPVGSFLQALQFGVKNRQQAMYHPATGKSFHLRSPDGGTRTNPGMIRRMATLDALSAGLHHLQRLTP